MMENTVCAAGVGKDYFVAITLNQGSHPNGCDVHRPLRHPAASDRKGGRRMRRPPFALQGSTSVSTFEMKKSPLGATPGESVRS
jgi:hypothetical protein